MAELQPIKPELFARRLLSREELAKKFDEDPDLMYEVIARLHETWENSSEVVRKHATGRSE